MAHIIMIFLGQYKYVKIKKDAAITTSKNILHLNNNADKHPIISETQKITRGLKVISIFI
jgi:hypothetical protein